MEGGYPPMKAVHEILYLHGMQRSHPLEQQLEEIVTMVSGNVLMHTYSCEPLSPIPLGEEPRPQGCPHAREQK